jgi:predicted deacylase
MEIGTATAKPGELTTGYLDVTDLPTGTPERLPVVVAQGRDDGPTVWVTAGIHGNEATGVAVAQDVMAESLARRLRGTVVCLPVLNPAGLRRNRRTSYYHADDPNRHFPDPDAESTRPPKVQEVIDGRIFEAFADSADALIDLHTAQPRSMPFVIRDRVLYGDQRDESEARDLADELNRLVDAFGLPVVNEYGAEEYTEQNLQRSTAGAALNNADIPAFTVELGGHGVVAEDAREAGVVGVYNVLRELDCLDGDPEPNDSVPAAPVEFPVKRAVHPHTDTPGVVRHLVEAGDVLEAGDPVAEVVTPHGEGKATVRSDHDGYVLARRGGLAVYENDSVASLAVRDEEGLVVARERGSE